MCRNLLVSYAQKVSIEATLITIASFNGVDCLMCSKRCPYCCTTHCVLSCALLEQIVGLYY